VIIAAGVHLGSVLPGPGTGLEARVHDDIATAWAIVDA
jgi:hypothetical protein